jgi:quinol monooxygenase YgiN
MVILHAYFSLLPNRVEESLEACRTVREASVTEPGCERYDFFQSPDHATKLVFVEEWTSKADLDTHFLQSAFLNFRDTMESNIAAPTEVRIFEASLLS